MPRKQLIGSVDDLITPHEKTRSGFVAMALEKNNLATPYVEEAKALKIRASRVSNPRKLLEMDDIRIGLLAASGLSEKAQNHLQEEDKILAIQELIEKYLVPAGSDFVDELIYRYLLTKGDTIGGEARNLAGALGERKFLRSLLSVFHLAGIALHWLEKKKKNAVWNPLQTHECGVENRIKAIAWKKGRHARVLVMNTNISMVKKNIDVTVCEGTISESLLTKSSILDIPDRMIAFGELKGGIDPAGADEHWKTADSALRRIRKSFEKNEKQPFTFFIGAAIERAMAEEIFQQLSSKTLHRAANLTNEEQLLDICDWIANL